MQDTFLDELTQAKSPVFCFLVNGIKLEGSIVGYDQFSIMLASNRDGATSQLIMKSAISTIVPKTASTATAKSY
ncbi:RNA chaperone Hfq [Thiolinea disciformis]|uniref:RNA chaperone Hfq n=1 Tax=Thiolinea disciformis TaxID=125614 RepID=UPI000365247A|nr:RNA chaperone Hfq [Thiolinea disciformis]